MKRIEPQLTEKYRKDPVQESFLERFNNILQPYQEEDYIEDLPEEYPTVHVIGVPRSGTTLVTQILATHTDIGYINNLIAAFWKAPVYGIRLSSQVVPRNLKSSYQSEFGRTKGIHEPHEFGYFWSELLHYREMLEQENKDDIDWKRVRLVLTNMALAFGRPVLFKSFLLGWHVTEVQKILPRTCWIHVYRDPLANILSLLKLRKELLGSVEKWASLKPKEYTFLRKQSYLEQVVGQYYFLERSYREQLAQIPTDNVFHLSYEDFCRNPNAVLSDFQKMLNRQNSSIKITSEAPKFTPNIHQSSELEMAVNKLLEKLQENYGSL